MAAYIADRLLIFKAYTPGIIICLTVAAAARFLSEHYGAPQMLFALLIGMTLHFLMEDEKCKLGVEIASKSVLRLGVALLGLRITTDQVVSVGITSVAWMALGVFLTMGLGLILAHITGCGRKFGLLTGGSVGICGASAALAISSTFPKDETSERNTIFVVLSVTTLSTLAMIIYPIFCAWLDFNQQQAGLFLGGTIHDVAQVIGAGYSLSEQAGDVSTILKLFRVSMLAPVVIGLGIAMRLWLKYASINSANTIDERKARVPFPLFVVGFCVLMALNSMNIIPNLIREPLVNLSSWCLVIAIAALGIKTSLKSLASVGYIPLTLMVVETAFIAVWVLLGILFVV